MAKSDDDFYKKIRKNILSWSYLVDDQRNYDALQRLANSTIAKLAWLELSKKQISNEVSEKYLYLYRDIYCVANWIGRRSVNGYLQNSEKLTSKEINEVSRKAIKLASELKSLILENSILRFSGDQLMPENERAAQSRILQGLINQVCELHEVEPHAEGRIFSDKIEAEINETQAMNYENFKDLTSIDAYKILRHREIYDFSFIRSLELFESGVKEFKPNPILPRPNKELADENVYSNMICETLNKVYGSPCFEISANFCTAFFDHDFEVDTIKKWWQRRQDTSS